MAQANGISRFGADTAGAWQRLRQVFALTKPRVVSHMSGWIYLAAALVLGGIFLTYAARLYHRYSDRLAHATFRYSIVYLALLFAALLADRYL